MSMNNDERLFMMMATIEQLVEQTKQQQAVITAQSEQISQLANTVEKQLETIKDLKRGSYQTSNKHIFRRKHERDFQQIFTKIPLTPIY